MRGIFLAKGDPLLPKHFSVAPVEAHERPAFFAINCLGYEHLVPPNHRRGIAALRQGDFPGNILICAPAQGELTFLGHTRSLRASPLGPVGWISSRAKANDRSRTCGY